MKDILLKLISEHQIGMLIVLLFFTLIFSILIFVIIIKLAEIICLAIKTPTKTTIKISEKDE